VECSDRCLRGYVQRAQARNLGCGHSQLLPAWFAAGGPVTLCSTTVLPGGGVAAVAFSPVDKVVATASGDAAIKLWDVKSCICLKTFDGHDASVLQVVFCSAGTQLLSSGADGCIKLWTVKTDSCVATYQIRNRSTLICTPGLTETCLRFLMPILMLMERRRYEEGHEEARVWALALRDDEGELLSAGALAGAGPMAHRSYPRRGGGGGGAVLSRLSDDLRIVEWGI
jgi:WD40 repeat protein